MAGDHAVSGRMEGHGFYTAHSTAQHVFGEQALPDLLDAGVDCIEHGAGLGRETIAQMVEALYAAVDRALEDVLKITSSTEEKTS